MLYNYIEIFKKQMLGSDSSAGSLPTLYAQGPEFDP